MSEGRVWGMQWGKRGGVFRYCDLKALCFLELYNDFKQ